MTDFRTRKRHGRRHIHVFHNGPGAHGKTIRFKVGYLPSPHPKGQTLVWLGPWFILVN